VTSDLVYTPHSANYPVSTVLGTLTVWIPNQKKKKPIQLSFRVAIQLAFRAGYTADFWEIVPWCRASWSGRKKTDSQKKLISLLNWRGTRATGWRRPIGLWLYTTLYGADSISFPQKSPIIVGSFAKNDLQLKAYCGSSPPCIGLTLYHKFAKVLGQLF